MIISKSLINGIELEAKKYFNKASGCHDWTHVERVRNLALQIGKKEKADLKIIELAALLHDIARKDEMKSKGKLCHAEHGAKLAKVILQKYKISPEIIAAVIHSIESHRFRNNKEPKTIEAKCLFDADKLDSIGAVGIGRDFLFAGYHKVALYTGKEKYYAQKGIDRAYTEDDSGIMEYEFKLKKIKNKILTKTGKKIARERHKYMVEFFNRFWQEVKGLK
ncbi:MAG: HD domain-containing protein [Candidatus Parcubacteria bacterium]|nr:HD domain-containing protein [Candidatus Parcubacteria bacterium]